MYVKFDLTAANGASCLQEPLVEEGSEDESDVESPVKRGSAEAVLKDSRTQQTGGQVKRTAEGQGRISPSRLQKSTRQEDSRAEAAPVRFSQSNNSSIVQGSSRAGTAPSQPSESAGSAIQMSTRQESSDREMAEPSDRAGRVTQSSASQESSGMRDSPVSASQEG